jgi:WD40 repeat protein
MVQLQRYNGATCSAVDPPLIIKPHAGTVRSLMFVNGNGGNELIATGGGGDFSVSAHDSATGQTVVRMEGHTGAVNALSDVGGRGGLVASAGGDATVKLWDVRAGKMNLSFAIGASAATAIAAKNDQLAIGQEDGTVSLLDVRMGACTHQGSEQSNHGNHGPHNNEVKSLQYAPFGPHQDMLLSCSYVARFSTAFCARGCHWFPRHWFARLLA